MKKRLLIVFSLFAFISNAQSLDQNFTMSIVPKEAMTNTELNTASASSVLKNITYFDGLGRPIQSNAIGQSPNNKDILQHYDYDQFGRTEKTYLPLPSNQNTGNFINSPIPQIEAYYKNKYGDNNPFGQQRFDNSPLSRVLESASPGNDWRMSTGMGNSLNTSYTINTPLSNENRTASQYILLTNGAYITGDVHLSINEVYNGHTRRFEYQTNANNVEYRFDVNSITNRLSASFYKENQLLKNIIKDENWQVSDGKLNTIEILKDKNNRTIAENKYVRQGNTTKKLTTYNVYDDQGRLSYILPPKFDLQNLVTSRIEQEYHEVSKEYYFDSSLYNSQYGLVSANFFVSPTSQDLSITIEGNFQPTNQLTTGYYFDIELADGLPPLPDATLGKLRCKTTNNQIIEPYTLLISNGKLRITGFSPNIDITAIEKTTYTINLPQLGYTIPQSYFITNTEIVTYNSELLNQEKLDNLAFQYRYDQYNRQIAQKVPGKGWEYVVYDQLDNPILIQDANLKQNNLWLFTKYDAFGRAIYSGKYSSTKTREALQSEVDSFINASSNKANIEQRTGSVTSIGGISINYTNNAFPKTGISEVLTINYFDDYDFIDSDKPSTPTAIEGQIVSAKTKGLPTSSWIKTLDNNSWSKTYTYYDQKGRSIKVYEKNHLGGYTTTNSKIDFRGKVEKSITEHKRMTTSSLLTINERYEYDHAERLASQYQKINNQPEEHIITNLYDELGNLDIKKTGGSSSSSVLQNTSYAYNIRGWLKEINDVDDINDNLFAFKLNYNDPLEGGDVTNSESLYNGNISQTIWRSKLDNLKQSYAYNYNALDQLTGADYLFGDILNRLSNNKFEVRNITYDLNGNIKTLSRYAENGSGNPADPNSKVFDNLNYNYGTAKSNQLLSITDNGDKTVGFIDGNISGNDYDYDDNGNLTKDSNKGISTIEYNHLDLVKKVTFDNGRNIKFTYDASGRKLSKVYTDGIYSVTTEYMGGFQYQQGQLLFFPTDAGYTYKDNSTNTFKYVYILSDHLGNNRVTYSDTDNNGTISTDEILSNTDYYPMGLIRNGEFNNSIASNFNYKFQGKELQTDNAIALYDFGSRMYDPTVGRWFNTDPQNQFSSPYLAMGNNSITSIDPNGEIAFAVIGIIAATAIGGGYNAISTASNGGSLGESLGSFIQGAAVSGFSATVGAASGGAVAASGVSYFGTLAAVTSSVTSTATSNLLTGNNLTDGIASSAIGSAAGAYIGGGSGAFAGGAISGGLEKTIDGGNFGEVLSAAGTSGAISLVSYEIMEELAYQDYQNGPREFGDLKRSGFRKFSRAGQRSFARNRESGGYFLDNGDVGEITIGSFKKLSLPDRPSNAIGDFHFHTNRTRISYPSYGADFNGHKSDNSYVINWKGKWNSGELGEVYEITPKLRSQINKLSHGEYSLSFRPELQTNIPTNLRIPQQIFSSKTNINRAHLHYYNKRF